MNDFESTLRRTLEHAADQAPRLPGVLAGELEKGHQRRRNRSQALLAAAAVVVVAGGVVLGSRVGGDQGPSPAATPSSVPSVTVTGSGATPVPVILFKGAIEDVWPQAVYKMPAKDQDGRELRPILFIDDRTLLVRAWRSFDKTEVLYSYDLDLQKLRKIADVTTPKGTMQLAADFSVGDGQVAWWTMTKRAVHIWTAPLDGGEPRLAAEQKIENGAIPPVDGFDVANGNVVFSLPQGGVFSVPLTGGAVTPVPRGDGLHLLSWPWAGSPGATSHDKPPFTQLVNLETGQTSTAVVNPGEQLIACGVRTCIGGTKDEKTFTRLRDGSQQKEIPSGFQIPEPPSQSRFYIRNLFDDRPGLGLYDLNTGTVADLGIREEATRGEVPVPDRITGRLMSYKIKSGMYVIDLSKIP
ncbi:cell wall synthesis protein CwsA [Sphaerisporangium fuscum]|uniref:cell wall synthesis protein CwsA n=1 Tax=Sphaerisporangium fuscum TaxID=2835868 RepID=UPI001BDBFF77|nr:cell wall synthesis protein CwsA [Sphaerisporangium fuscum]